MADGEGWKMWRGVWCRILDPKMVIVKESCGRVKEVDCDWGCYKGVKGATNRRVDEEDGKGIHSRSAAGTGRLVDRVRMVEEV